MDLTLSASEQKQLDRAATTLLSPLHYPTVDAWRSGSNTALAGMLGADCATFMLPDSGGAYLYSDEWPPEISNAYPERVALLDRKHNFWCRQLQAGVWSRRQIFNSAMYRSAYYNEFVVPNRAFDAIGITIECRGGALAGVLFHHTSRRGRRFGAHGLARLRLLRPAFTAGVHALQAMRGHRHTMARTLDLAPSAMALLTNGGRLLHANHPAAELLRRSHGITLRVELERLARKCVSAPANARHTLLLDGERYELDATRAGEELGALHATVVIAIGADEQRLRIEISSRLADTLGLTPQEARVAALLGERRSNGEIARLLGISEHTARHHTERVLAKLGVHSRGAVAARMRRALESLS